MKQEFSPWVYNAIRIVFLFLIFIPLLIWIGRTIGESRFRDLVRAQNASPAAVKESVTRHGSSSSTDSVFHHADLTKQKVLGKKVTHGLDVSHYQGTIRWDKFKRYDLEFVLIKATGGETYVDPHFHHNWNGVRETGIIRGAYHFFYAADDPRKQAAHFISTVGKLRSQDLPPVLDVEIPDHTPAKQLQQSVLVWLQLVEKGLKRIPMVYTDDAFGQEYLQNASLARYPLWIAVYEKTVSAVPSPWKDKGWTFWQYTQDGRVEGINGTVDLDLFKGDLKELKLFIDRSKVN